MGMDMLSITYGSTTHQPTQSAFKKSKKKSAHKLSTDC